LGCPSRRKMMMMMSKKVLIGVAAGFVGAGVLAAAKKCQQGPSPDMWAKMREKMEEMPADFPPRVMFDDVEATRANTEEILALLSRDTAGAHQDAEAAATS
jgi:hypothetical protein